MFNLGGGGLSCIYKDILLFGYKKKNILGNYIYIFRIYFFCVVGLYFFFYNFMEKIRVLVIFGIFVYSRVKGGGVGSERSSNFLRLFGNWCSRDGIYI